MKKKSIQDLKKGNDDDDVEMKCYSKFRRLQKSVLLINQ